MLEWEKLVRRFWDDRTTPADNERLIGLLDENGESFRQALENDFIEGASDLDSGRLLDSGISKETASLLLDCIHRRLGMERPASMRKARIITLGKWMSGSAVAASVCMIAISFFLMHGAKQGVHPAVAKTNTPPIPRLTHLINHSDTMMTVVLDDGSIARLGRHSSLAWYRPFIGNCRYFSLEGTGLFKVAKDARRPFTVYASGTATTALGTKFWVGAEEGKDVKVRLLEGKVVVNAVAGSGLNMEAVYLAPGQEFLLDKLHLQYTVQTIPARSVHSDGMVAGRSNRDLAFDKEPLASVFKKIGRIYHIPLRFNKEDMDSLYFTGTFLKTDSLNRILSTICNVNGLLLIEYQDSIIIKK